ncbi:MAG: MBL fold metallo-hydrolase [Clostridia bacterium]|nr:MBL fold metallo-hydrolase [Clostridia bacterium]
MQLIPLGVNGPYPASNGATSGYLLCQGDTAVQLDLGSGTLGRLTAYMPPERLDALILTHWHFDHCADVLPLLYRLQALGKQLQVYAPVDEKSPIRDILRKEDAVCLHDLKKGDTLQIGEMTFRVYPGAHPVPAIMLRIESRGKTLCYTGDTNLQPCLGEYMQDADLLLIDGLFTRETWAVGKPHLSAALAAELARDHGVKRLVITHLNPAIDSCQLLEEAREAFLRAEICEAGHTYAVE